MLKTECTRCKVWIAVPFLSEGEVRCPRCAEVNSVKEVHVAAGPFTIFRDVLARNMFKYKRLLAEAEREVEYLKKQDSGGSYDLSIKSISLFISNLKELLDGCRYETRHSVKENDGVEYSIENRLYCGRIINISLSGVCIDCGKNAELTRLWSEIGLRFRDESGSRDFLVQGKIMWIGKGSLVGIKFLELDGEVKGFLKEFILERSRVKA